MDVIGLQVYFVHTFKLRFGKQEGVSVLQRKTSPPMWEWWPAVPPSSSSAAAHDEEHDNNMFKPNTNLYQYSSPPVLVLQGCSHARALSSMLHQCTDAPFPCPPHAVTLTVQRPSAYSLGWHIPGATPSLQVCLDVVAAAWTHSSHFKWLCGAWAQHMLVWLCPTLCKGLCSCEQLVY